MKKVLLFLFSLFLCINVYAEKMDDYVSVDETIQSESKSLSYIGLQLKDGNIVFEGIENISKKKIPISFSIALFNDEGSNIGMVNYCSKEDIQSEFSGKELYKSEKVAFSMFLKSDYFGTHGKKKEKYTYDDIAYYALINDNVDCKIGSATRYVGMSYDEIMDGYSNDSKKPAPKDRFYLIFLIGGALFVVWIIINIIYRSGVTRRRKQRFKTYSEKMNQSTSNDNNNAGQFFQKIHEEHQKPNEEQTNNSNNHFVQSDIVAENEKENHNEDNSSDLMNLYK